MRAAAIVIGTFIEACDEEMTAAGVNKTSKSSRDLTLCEKSFSMKTLLLSLRMMRKICRAGSGKARDSNVEKWGCGDVPDCRRHSSGARLTLTAGRKRCKAGSTEQKMP